MEQVLIRIVYTSWELWLKARYLNYREVNGYHLELGNALQVPELTYPPTSQLS